MEGCKWIMKRRFATHHDSATARFHRGSGSELLHAVLRRFMFARGMRSYARSFEKAFMIEIGGEV